MVTTPRALLVSAFLVLAGAPAQANDASISFVGGTPMLVAEESVRLAEEHLVFRFLPPAESEPPGGGRCDDGAAENAWRGRCSPGWWCQEEDGRCRVGERWAADLTYVLQNTGAESRELEVGLPFRMPWSDSEHIGPNQADPIDGFTTHVDDQPAEVRQVDEESNGEVPFNRVYVTRVRLEPGQTRTLTHRYSSHASIASSGGEVEYHYLLETARSWAGPIGRVRIDFQLPAGAGPCVMVSLPAQRDGDWLRVDLTDWSPARNFEVMWASRETVLYMAWEGDLPSFDVAAETAADVCAEALASPAEGYPRLAALVELLYGAPADGSRSSTRAEGPAVWCRNAADFGYLLDHPEAATRRGFDPSVVTWRDEASFPGNMPPALRACVDELRGGGQAPASQPTTP